jgi:hypothetical protein
MGLVFTIHQIFGERILPILIVLVAIWLTVTWKPGAAYHPAARIFPALVGLQVLLGLIFFIFGLINGRSDYLTFPFILHPIIGFVAAGVAGMAVRPDGPARALGRWAPLATLGVLLVLVVANIIIARSV